MKILYVIPSYIPAYRIGGPVKLAHDLCKALVKRGVEVTVFTTTVGLGRIPKPLTFKDKIDGVNIVYFPASFLKKYNHAYGIARAIRKSVKDYDIVHIFSIFSYTTLVASSACRKYRVPYILNPLGALDRSMINLNNALVKKIYLAAVEKNNIEGAFAIQVASDYELKKVKELGFKKRIEIIPPGLDLSEYGQPRGMFYTRYTEPKDGNIILYLGRIHPKKGIEILLEAFKKLVAQRDDVYLMISGPMDKYAKKIMSSIIESRLNSRVIFSGMLLGADKTAAFYRSDIFVLPSSGENFGIAALEALACGLPVVLTKEVGLSSDVLEYRAGIIVKQGVLEISEAMEELISNPDLREAISLRAKNLVRERFNIDDIADRVVRLYLRIPKRKL
jgi:glycosyltransferase involved in cell wall biosynthesis